MVCLDTVSPFGKLFSSQLFLIFRLRVRLQDHLPLVLQVVIGVCTHSTLYSLLLGVPELGAVASRYHFVAGAPCRGDRGESRHSATKHPTSSPMAGRQQHRVLLRRRSNSQMDGFQSMAPGPGASPGSLVEVQILRFLRRPDKPCGCL